MPPRMSCLSVPGRGPGSEVRRGAGPDPSAHGQGVQALHVHVQGQDGHLRGRPGVHHISIDISIYL